jgi:hypothetical protein
MTQFDDVLAADARRREVGAATAGGSTWVGWAAFAAMMMVLLGTFHALQGLVALTRHEYFLVAESGLVLDVDFTAWGWVHLVAGIVVILAGLGVMRGQMWARVTGTILAMVSAVLNLAFLAAYPLWSVMMIALDVMVILALTVHGSEGLSTED